MKASISIDEELWTRFRMAALAQGITASRLLYGVVAGYLEEAAMPKLPERLRPAKGEK